MKPLVLLSFLLLSLTIHSQILKGFVTDSISKENLPYANLVLKGENIGVYSNEDGSYRFNLFKATITDTLVVSLIGFQNKKIALSQFTDAIMFTYNFQLVPKTEALDEILIVSNSKKYNSKTEKLSTGNRKTTFPTSTTFGSEVVTLIENPKDKNGKLVELQLKFKKRSNEDYTTYQTYFRLYFYNVDDIGFPGELLNFENIIIKPKIEDQNFKINLEDKHIVFTEKGFFVGIETIKPENVNVTESMYLTTPNILYTHTPKPLKHYRFGLNEWKTSYRKSVFKKKLYSVPFIKVNVVYKKE